MSHRTLSRARLLRMPRLPRRAHLSRLLLVCVLVTMPQFFAGGALVGSPARAEPSPTCGAASVAELRDVIGPNIVGDCLDHERYTQANGDTFQPTTRGLLIEKAGDRWTAFTDGTSTWVNGPYGLEKRVGSASSASGGSAVSGAPAGASSLSGWRPISQSAGAADTGVLGSATLGPAAEAHMSPGSQSPPELSSAQRDTLARSLRETHLPGLAVPTGPLVQGTRPPAMGASDLARDDTRGAPADLTVFRSTSLPPAVPGSFRSVVDEPSVSNNGPVVFYTGNWYAASSNDSGATFTYVNPYTGFPASYGGFCCDQVTIYDPSRDITIWSLQYIKDTTGNSRRIAVANGQTGVVNNSWVYWDLTAQMISSAPVSNQPGYWLDYGHVELGSNYLYVSSNVYSPSNQSVGTVLFRLPLDALATHGSLSVSYFYSATTFSFQPVAGASNPMYFGQHLNTSTLRFYRWPETGSLTVSDVPHASFIYGNSGAMVCTAPDGTNPCARSDSRMETGWTWGSEVAFMWNAAQGTSGLGTFPYPYVHVTRINAATGTLLDEPILWSAQRAYEYPGASVNAQGTVGVSATTAGGGTFPNSVVLLRDQAGGTGWEQATLRVGTNGPGDSQWGDYLTARLASGSGPSFVGTTYTLQGACAGSSQGCATVEPRFVWFGRQRDYPFPPTCAPRPPVQLQVTPTGSSRLQVVVSTSGTGVFIQSVRFGAANNGVIDIAGQVGVPGNFTVNLASGTQQTSFQVRRVGPGPVTVFLTVNDGCGPWPTFVGGGPNGF